MTELGYKTLRESIVDIIRKRIINRELQPGQKIVEQELAKEFQTKTTCVSRFTDTVWNI